MKKRMCAALLCVALLFSMSGCESAPAESAEPGDLQKAAAFYSRYQGEMGDYGYTREQMEEYAILMGQEGLVVSLYGMPMQNHERVLDFLEGEEDGLIDIFILYSYNMSGMRLIKENGAYRHGWLQNGADGVVVVDTSDVLWLKLRESGNLFLQLGEDFYTGMRVVPLPWENYDAYWTYLYPVSAVSAFINTEWSRPSYEGLTLEFLFEMLWNEETGIYTMQSAYYDEEADACWIPADLFESTIQSRFDLTVDQIRGATSFRQPIYVPERDVYKVAGWRGGGYLGELEVWEVAETAEGYLELTVAMVSYSFDDEGLNSVLTVEPRDDGSFVYVSHQLLRVED